MSIEELYNFAGVEKGCSNQEFMDALNNKIATFNPVTEEDKELLNNVKSSLDIINKVKERNDDSVKRVEEENAFNEHADEVMNIVNNQGQVETGIEDAHTDDIIDLVNNQGQVETGIDDEYTNETIDFVNKKM